MHESPKLLRFQERFLRRAMAPGVETAVWSAPRGNGKSYLAAVILARALDPGHKWFREGTESILCSGSFEQARVVFRFCREFLGESGYKYQDAANRIGITHKGSNTRLRVISSSGKRAMGLGVGNPLIVAEECGAWEVNNGGLLNAAIQGSLGKPGQETRAIYIGTIAPSTRGWWADMIDDGTYGTQYVQALKGDPAKWDKWPEIRRCNPLTAVDPKFRRRLLGERDKARTDSRRRAEFLSYRLNIPSADEATTLITTGDWLLVCSRDVPEPEGRPLCGVDIGRGRAWNAAVGIWPNGRIQAVAYAPGIPSLDAQEKRDRVPAGTYKRLVELGVLKVAEGLRVPLVKDLVKELRPWSPKRIIADRFDLDKLKDNARGIRIEDRVTRWSSATYDIDALRSLAKDGPLSCDEASRQLLTVSLAATVVKNDDGGSSRIVKRDPSNNTGRDDVSCALTLAAGAMKRTPARTGGVFLGAA